MNAYIDCHKGDHALVCGCGPSVRQYDPEWFMTWKGPTFGCNRILYWFTPRYHFSIYAYENCFCDTTTNHKVKFDWYNKAAPINLEKDGSLPHKGTVALAALNAAYQMGCSPISIIGIDMKASKDGRRYFYDQPGTGDEYLVGSHGMWMRLYLQEAIDMLRWRGVEVINLSEDSAL